ncbi:hypothetical protein F511_35733 [Dorcoceras hygrometricum]|uniref:Transmembrane protein n=1 Tax=Dorcoceras hygrometricum TaxID=472368 RepID=A0A2Z7AAZ6_9LAMI|nr:hypothetical protein F511_35733 [Dorcoceras hygrometricum]
MASPSDEVFVDGEVVEPLVKETDNPGANPEFVTSKSLKEEEKGGKKEVGKEEKKNGAENLKASLIISAVAIAVIGAIFAVAKKIKEA